MKRLLMRVVPWFFVACTVDTPVVEAGDDDRLRNELGAWCQSMCDRLDECGGDSRALCLENCLEYFSAFVDNGSVCRDAGLRVMDCMETATCEELDSLSGCNANDERWSCLESAGETICQGAFIDEAPTQGVLCTVGVDQCSDGKEFSLECLDESDPPECRCSASGLTTGRFTMSQFCPSVTEAIQICAWPLLHKGFEPPPTLCNVGGAELPGFNGGECSMHYGDCSDGREYDVHCLGTAGNVVCDCSVDGETVGSYDSFYGICPFVQDPDAGRVAANAGCGFKLAP